MQALCRQLGTRWGDYLMDAEAELNGRIWKYAGGPIKTHNKPGRRFPRKEAA